MASRWITRERPKIDRIACPWLIRRFIAEDAEFIYVPTEQVFAVAKETGATPYDMPGAEPFPITANNAASTPSLTITGCTSRRSTISP